jgi:hypothetical protein
MDTHRATTVGIEPVGDKSLQLEAQTSHVENQQPLPTEVK